MTEETKHMDIKAVRHLLEKAAAAFIREEAAYFADLYMEAHLRKYPRMNPLQEALDDIIVWEKSGEPGISMDVDKGAVFVVDFKGLAPSLKLKYIHDELEKRAAKFGIAAAGFRNSSGVVTLNPWSDGLARRDLIGISMFNGGVGCCVPHNGTRGFFGTAPLAYAIPTAGQPVVLDMATTEIPFFDIANARKEGRTLANNVAVDQKGRPTRDAEKAFGENDICNLLPMGGGFKGYGVVMLIEVLTGALVGSLTSAQQAPGWNPAEYGGLVIALDIASFTDMDRFKKDMSEMCTAIRGQQPARERDAVAVPGDRGHAKKQSMMASGVIEIADTLYQSLLKRASS